MGFQTFEIPFPAIFNVHATKRSFSLFSSSALKINELLPQD
jgi:hypothetical protein